MRVSQSSQWESNDKPQLRAIDGRKKSWREDWDFLEQYYLGALDDRKLDQGKTVRIDTGLLTEIGNMIATGKTPYKNFGEFVRDSCVKNFRIVGEQLGDPEFIRKAKAMQVYSEADHRKTIRVKNKTLLENLDEELSVAKTPREIQQVLDSCNAARDNMHGTQLQELNSLIGRVMGRLGEI